MIQTIAFCAALLCPGQPIIPLIELAAVRNGVSPDLMLCIAYRESSFNPVAVGDHDLSVGLFQMNIRTWRWFRQMMGKSTRDQRADPWQAANTAAWAVANGFGHHWSVWELCN